MSGKLIEKFAPHREAPSQIAANENQNAKPCLMLHVTLSDGTQWAEPYAYLLEAWMLPDRHTIYLRFTHRLIRIEGKRLQPVFLDLLRHQVAQIEAATGTAAAFDPDDGEPYVKAIDMAAPLKGGELNATPDITS